MLALVAVVALAAAGAGAYALTRDGAGSADEQELSGTFVLTTILERDCSRFPFTIAIKDGGGTVLRVVEGPTTAGGRSRCIGEYTATVPKANVYIVEAERYRSSSGRPYSITVNADDLADGERLPELNALLA